MAAPSYKLLLLTIVAKFTSDVIKDFVFENKTNDEDMKPENKDEKRTYKNIKAKDEDEDKDEDFEPKTRTRTKNWSRKQRQGQGLETKPKPKKLKAKTKDI